MQSDADVILLKSDILQYLDEKAAAAEQIKEHTGNIDSNEIFKRHKGKFIT